MFLINWLRGIVIGVLVTIPIGPVGILIIQRTLNRNRLTGLYSGTGAALSDFVYAVIAGFGMNLITDIIRNNQVWFHVVGSLIVFTLGVFIFLSHPERYAIKKQKKRKSRLSYVLGTFMIAFSNPYLIFGYIALFSGFNVNLSLERISISLVFLAGFLLGGLLWWFLLTWVIDHFRNWFNIKILLWFNRIAGAGIVLFSLLFLVHSIMEKFSA